MKRLLGTLLLLVLVGFVFQNCDSGFQSLTASSLSATDTGNPVEAIPNPGTQPSIPVISKNFLLQLNSAGVSDRFYSLRNVNDAEVVMVGQSEGFTPDNTMEAIFSFYNKDTGEQSLIAIDVDEYHDQFFHLEETPSGNYLASGIARTGFYSGSANTWSNDGLIVQLNPISRRVNWIKVVSRPLISDGTRGFDDNIRGVHQVGNSLYFASESGPGYPADENWEVIVGALTLDNQLSWAKLVNHASKSTVVRKTQMLEGNSLVIMGSTQTYNEAGTRTNSTSLVARFSLNGQLMWAREWPNSGVFNGIITSDNRIATVGQHSGNGQVVILDKDGNLLGGTTLVADENDTFFGIGEMKNGDLVVSGNMASQGYKDGYHDAIVFRYNRDLSELRWSSRYGNPNTHDRIENSHNIIEGPNGEIAVSGFTSVDPSNNDNDDAFAFQISGDGSVLEDCAPLSTTAISTTPFVPVVTDAPVIVTDVAVEIRDVDVDSNTRTLTSGNLPEVICSGDI